MLRMFSEIILCFIDELNVLENKYKKYNYYEPHEFLVEVKNFHTIEKTSVFENIIIKY